MVFVTLLLFFTTNVSAQEDQYDLIVLKIDSSSARLEGAEFAICNDQLCEEKIGRSANIIEYGEDSGYVNFNVKLDFNRSYYLKETKAPTGYRIRQKADGSQLSLVEAYINNETSTGVNDSFENTLLEIGLETKIECIKEKTKEYTIDVNPETKKNIILLSMITLFIFSLGVISLKYQKIRKQ